MVLGFFTIVSHGRAYFRVLMGMRTFYAALVLVFVISVTSTSCRKERFFNGNTSLDISADTVWFDTLFTGEPGTKYPISVTKIFWIKNREKATIKVDLRLAGGTNSAYRINADGVAGPEIAGLEIPARDSVFVFVQCSLEPNNGTMPALVVDSLISRVNGNEQKTYLAAYGWDAHYFHSVQLACGEVWADKVKPYVIIDNALVPENCTFTIKQGVKVYNSARSILIVAGTLKIEGTDAEPVKFAGDRLGFDTRTSPNQWGGIYFTVGSTNNTIRYASINNASVGIRVDSMPVAGTYNLEMENTGILYCGQAAVAGITAHIKATNCLFGESGSYSFLGLLGGIYDFRHCTFTGYSNFGTRQEGHFALTNTLRDGNGLIVKSEPLTCNAVNSIIYGSREEELLFDSEGSQPFAANMQNNIIRSKDQPIPGNTYNKDPLFTSNTSGEFSLRNGSPAIDAAVVLTPAVIIDYLGKPRDATPDIGAYEKQP
jgi:hypothetical protein